MKEVFAAIGIVTVVLVGYVVIKRQMHKHDDCGCGCGGNCKDEIQTQTMVAVETPHEHNCNSNGLGSGWITNYDVQKDFAGMTVNRA
jgi:hypothetical protein